MSDDQCYVCLNPLENFLGSYLTVKIRQPGSRREEMTQLCPPCAIRTEDTIKAWRVEKVGKDVEEGMKES